MKRNIGLPLKAIFLLIVFFLNTVVGFACSLGADLIFNAAHSESHDIHAHDSAMPNDHSLPHHHDHSDEDLQSAEHSGSDHHHLEKDHKDKCCGDEVLKLEKTDKLIESSKVNTVSFNGTYTFVFAAFYDFNLFALSKCDLSKKYFFCQYHPPIPDIRIAIQSFQI